MKNPNINFYLNIKNDLQEHIADDTEVIFDDLIHSIRIVQEKITLHIHVKSDLIGYEIYPIDALRQIFLSDTDLYKLEDSKELRYSIEK